MSTLIVHFINIYVFLTLFRITYLKFITNCSALKYTILYTNFYFQLSFRTNTNIIALKEIYK